MPPGHLEEVDIITLCRFLVLRDTVLHSDEKVRVLVEKLVKERHRTPGNL